MKRAFFRFHAALNDFLPPARRGVAFPHEFIGPRTFAMDVKVDCYAGYRGEETPRRFEIDGRRVEVVEVIDRWFGPDHRYFKVRGDDGAVYLLRHDDLADRWELKTFERDEA